MIALSALTAFREDNDLSQEELAEMLGVSRPAISRWETGARKIDSKFVPLVSKRTGIPVADLRPDLFLTAAE